MGLGERGGRDPSHTLQLALPPLPASSAGVQGDKSHRRAGLDADGPAPTTVLKPICHGKTFQESFFKKMYRGAWVA